MHHRHIETPWVQRLVAVLLALLWGSAGLLFAAAGVGLATGAIGEVGDGDSTSFNQKGRPLFELLRLMVNTLGPRTTGVILAAAAPVAAWFIWRWSVRAMCNPR